MMLSISKPIWDYDRKGVRRFTIRIILAVLLMGFVSFVYSGYVLLVERPREWKRAAAPFQALGARVHAGGGGDMGYFAGRKGITRIAFDENVGDAEIAALANQMEELPNLDSLILRGSRVTDAGMMHLKRLGQLRHLLLIETRVSEKGRAELLRSLPNLSYRL